ncbi:MAG: hypothetical protein ACPGSD_15305 [Flavobacteriales bacterium]
MDNLTRTQLCLHYLQVLLSKLKLESSQSSDFIDAFFSGHELGLILVELNKHEQIGFQLTDVDILALLIEQWKEDQERCLDPNDDFVKKLNHHLGSFTHYLSEKPVDMWDEYDYSNYQNMVRKAVKAKFGFGIFQHDIHHEDIDAIVSKPFRWFSSEEDARTKRYEMLEDGLFSEEELIIHKDLRPL